MKKQKENMKGITLIALVLTIIVLLILAGVSISMLTGDNGILTQAQIAKEMTEASSEEEYIQLLVVGYNTDKKTYGEELKNVEFNTVENTTSIMDKETGTTYGDGWYYLKPEDVKDYELKNSYIIDYETGEYIKYNENKHEILTNELLCISDGLVYSADPKNMTSGDSWGDAILHNFNEGDENSGWKYFNYKGKPTSEKIQAQILMMKRTNIFNGFFIFLDGDFWVDNHLGNLCIDIGGCSSNNNADSDDNRFYTSIYAKENEPMYITYTYNPNKENENGVLYVNGVKTETTNLGIIENLVNTPPNTPIQIGSDIYETYNLEGDTVNHKYPFNGEIYASRVYNRPLTEQEVLYNYNTTVNNR